jgi:hypothetical protein
MNFVLLCLTYKGLSFAWHKPQQGSHLQDGFHTCYSENLRYYQANNILQQIHLQCKILTRTHSAGNIVPTVTSLSTSVVTGRQ